MVSFGDSHPLYNFNHESLPHFSLNPESGPSNKRNPAGISKKRFGNPAFKRSLTYRHKQDCHALGGDRVEAPECHCPSVSGRLVSI